MRLDIEEGAIIPPVIPIIRASIQIIVGTARIDSEAFKGKRELARGVRRETSGARRAVREV